MSAAPSVWVISDVHVDYDENLERLRDFAAQGHPRDALIVAGDASDRLERLENLFEDLVARFGAVLFVPGNHELWLRKGAEGDSTHKLDAVLELCRQLGVHTGPLCFGRERRVWLVPLLSWYADKHDPAETLYVEKPYAQDKTSRMWIDFMRTRWPAELKQRLPQWFAARNEPHVQRDYDAPVISFSHFLPRQELMFPPGGLPSPRRLAQLDPLPEFNFSRVAGARCIEAQIRRLGSRLHVYGHQHRNRRREIEGVTYLSHCMGYPSERNGGNPIAPADAPLRVWTDDDGFLV